MSSLFYILSSTTKPTWIKDALRQVLFTICKGIFSLVEDIFNLFFQIVNFEAFGEGIADTLFSRLFMVIGIFMFFKISISLITYLMNPDTVKDKEKGLGKMFSRLIVMLIFLLLLMPWSEFSVWQDDTDSMTAEQRNELYKNNGLLFGLLYDAQKRIINDGTISMLILGEQIDNDATMKKASKVVSLSVLRAFAPLNTNCDSVDLTAGESITFNSLDDIGNRIDERCTAKTGNTEYYLFDFSGFTAILAGLGTCIIVFLFCFDVAIRMIKLGILRLLSPIPAISYIDPKSSRDGTFAAYVKILTSTYMDLFVRLAIIFLVIYLISSISKQDTGIFSVENGNPGWLAKAIIYISLLFFAGQAPKFIMQALGIKSKGTGLGFGAALLGGALAGTIAGAATGGIWGAVKGTVGGATTGSQNQWKAQNGQQRQGSAIQEARARGAVLGKGEVDPSKQGLTSMVGGWIGNKITGTTEKNLDKMKQASYANNNRKGEVDNLISNLGKTAGIGEGQSFTKTQKDLLVEAGMRVTVKDGKVQVEDKTGNILDNNGISEFLTRYSQDLESRGKVMEKNIKYLEEENAKRNVHANWKNYTATKRVQHTDTRGFATKTKTGRHENDIRRDV